jgi:hypothetical protein
LTLVLSGFANTWSPSHLTGAPPLPQAPWSTRVTHTTPPAPTLVPLPGDAAAPHGPEGGADGVDGSLAGASAMRMEAGTTALRTQTVGHTWSTCPHQAPGLGEPDSKRETAGANFATRLLRASTISPPRRPTKSRTTMIPKAMDMDPHSSSHCQAAWGHQCKCTRIGAHTHRDARSGRAHASVHTHTATLARDGCDDRCDRLMGRLCTQMLAAHMSGI